MLGQHLRSELLYRYQGTLVRRRCVATLERRIIFPRSVIHQILPFLTLCARVAYTKEFEISRRTWLWAVRTAREMDYREAA